MKKFVLFLFSLCCTVTSQLFGVIACPDPVTESQPDGSEITFYVRGDERINWLESMDEYTLLRNAEHVIVYATLNEQGDMVPSDIIARNTGFRLKSESAFLSNIPKKLFYSKNQIDAFRQRWAMSDSSRSTPTFLKTRAEEINALCILVETEDRPFTKTQEDFDRLLNEIGYNDGASVGSVKDFYKECTYGAINMNTTVIGPYRASKSMAYYADKNERELMLEAVELAVQDGVNFAKFDNDGDRRVDIAHFIFAGHGKEASAKESIWSHKSVFYPEQYMGGAWFNVYSCSPELRGAGGSSLTAIGVIAHELGHVFGAPDYYDIDYAENGSYAGTGNWDLMAQGSWNGEVSGGTPPHMNMHQKCALGWVTPTILSSPTEVKDIPNSAENPVAYMVRAGGTSEYFLLDNRQLVGFDSKIPGHGLLIYHVHENATQDWVDNRSHPQWVYPVCASSEFTVPKGSAITYGSINTAGCPFPGTSNNTEFTDETTPAMMLWTGYGVGKPITDIVEDTENKTISFYFRKPTVAIESQENEDLFHVAIYPNPAEDNVNIKLSGVEGSADAAIYDINGKLIKRYTWDGDASCNISLHDFAKGIYFIKVATNRGEMTKKLMVN